MRVLSQVVHTKDVDFFGHTLTVPNWVDYLAADSDGKVWGYGVYKPLMNDDSAKWTPDDLFDDYPYDEMAEVDLEGMDWTQTLVKL